jgi:hypothetical protein
MIHVFPTNDIKEHMIDDNHACNCNPRIYYENGEMIVIHNSYDGRETREFNLLEEYGKETHYRYIGDDEAMNSMIWHYYKNYSHNGIDIDWVLDARKRWKEKIGSPTTFEWDDAECKKEIAGCDLILSELLKIE